MSEVTTSSIKVLLVDDEPTQMALIKLNLEETDTAFKITLTTTPKEALTLLKNEHFDCIVSDFQMPEMNGIELCKEVKKNLKTPFIIYTAKGSEEVVSAAFSAGVDDYIRKEPNLVHYLVLSRRIRNAVEKKRADEARELVQEYANRLEGMVETGRTKLHDSEERLRRILQMNTLGRIGATVAHDLQGPLVTISQASEMAKAKKELSDKMLGLISDNAKRSLEMIERFRESTREVKAVKSRVELSSLVRVVLEEVPKPDNVEFEVCLGEGLNPVFVDSGLIRRVLENLVRNGVEAMPDGGSLTVSAAREVDNVVIEVIDTGVGVKEEDQKNLFEPLFTRKKGGLGLGLYFVLMAVDAHGGVVSFNSRVGKGTTFKILLPVE